MRNSKIYLIYPIIVLLFVFPSFAFSGAIVYYSELSEKYWQIAKYDAEKKSSVLLTTTPFDKRNPVCSPDGKTLLFRTGNGELYRFDLETKKEEQVQKDIKYLVDPQWLNNEDILVTRYRTDVLDDSDIWQVNIKTGEKKVLVSEPRLQYQPCISPDKKLLVYVSAMSSASDQLFLKDLATGKAKRLTQGEFYYFLPSFSPDGKKIAFVSSISGDNEIYIMDLNSSNARRLTEHPGIDTHPKWMNNENIVYMSFENGKFQINTANINTLEMKPLIIKETDCADPEWKE